MNRIFLLGIVVSSCLMAGCTTTESNVARPFANGPPGPIEEVQTGAPPSVPPPAVAEMDITVRELVRRTLKEDPELSAVSKRVEVKVHRGVVTLRGHVPTIQDRNLIVDRISNVPGVDGVDDRLKLGSH